MTAFLLAITTMPATAPASVAEGPSLTTWMLLLAALSVVPFVLTMVTSFAKLIIVGGIVRQAIGAQVPPNSVLTGLALILSVMIMWPVGWQGYSAYDSHIHQGDSAQIASLAAAEPLKHFLHVHSSLANVELFEQFRQQLENQPGPNAAQPPLSQNAAKWVDLAAVDVPAFVVTELTQAFKIGFLLYVPFLVIDLIVGNVLVSMGMTMLTPTTISLPLKLLMFVMIDGWRLLVQGLVAGYAVKGSG